MRRVHRCLLKRPPDRLGNGVIADAPRRPRPGLVIKPLQTPFGEASAPYAARIRRRAKLRRDRLVLKSLGGQKNDACAPRQTLCRPPPPRQVIELPTLRNRKINRNRYPTPPHHLPP